MRYLALDFETGNASPLSACALGASVFEDNQLVDEKISLIRPPECVGRFHWGNVRVNHIKEKMVADARYVRYECALQLSGALRTENARMPVLMHGKGVQAGMA